MNGSESVDRVAAVLAERGHPHPPRMLADSARTAQEAADALGVQLGQIAKSIVFRRRPDDALVMVVTSGDQRVDEKKLAALACADGQKLGRADADFVRERTGFVIGGVAPLAHLSVPLLWLDLSLFRFDQVWAAAGHPHAVFPATPAQLALLTQARLDDVASMAPAAAFCHVQCWPSPLVGLLLQQQPQPLSPLLQGCLLLLLGCLLLTPPQAMRLMLLCTGGFVAQPITLCM